MLAQRCTPQLPTHFVGEEKSRLSQSRNKLSFPNGPRESDNPSAQVKASRPVLLFIFRRNIRCGPV